MKPIFEMDVNAFVRSLNQIQLDPRILKTVEAALSDRIEANAREKLKNGPLGTMIAEGVTSKIEGDILSIGMKKDENNIDRIAEHVEKGGPIKSSNGKKLAIPLNFSGSAYNAVKGLYPTNKSIHDKLFLVPRKGRNSMLFYRANEKDEARPAYVLVKETKPQKPRPFFPTEAEVKEIINREVTWWAEHKLPKVIE